MKILHVCVSDGGGGAAIAASRLNKAMQDNGVDSSMLVLNKIGIDRHTYKISPLIRRRLLIYNKLLSRSKKNLYAPYGTFSTGKYGTNITKIRPVQDADIIYLHWINGCFLSIKNIRQLLALRKPVIWFMHDMWPITGGCHYSFNCEKYTVHCCNCPNIHKHIWGDISQKVFNKKKKSWGKYRNLYVITPSNWLGECARKSFLFSGRKIDIIPNVLDSTIFKPLEQNIARQILNMPLHKRIILFGAADGTKSPYKGWTFLQSALTTLHIENVELWVFGGDVSPETRKTIPFSIHTVGKLADEYTLMLLYNAVDVFVTPSLADNFPNVILEAMFCGTPVVGFNVGGIPDLVKHKKTGYLATYKDSDDLADGITWVLDNMTDVASRSSLREYMLATYAASVSVQKHLDFIDYIGCK